MRLAAVGVAFLLIALSGAVSGLWTGRWGVSRDVTAAAARCQDVPEALGDWEGRPAEVNERQLAVAEVVGHLSRRYVNRRTGQQVAMLLICGRPGPLSVHTPDVCYAGSGYAIVGKPQTWRPGARGPDAEVLTARFRKPGVAPEPLRVCWAWSDGGRWSAPENPRLTYSRSGALYKLYVVRALGEVDEPLDRDPCVDFLKVLLPELRRCLSPTPAAPGG